MGPEPRIQCIIGFSERYPVVTGVLPYWHVMILVVEDYAQSIIHNSSISVFVLIMSFTELYSLFYVCLHVAKIFLVKLHSYGPVAFKRYEINIYL